MSSPLTFGSALKAMRQALGLSQLALAERLGSTQRHLSFLETGRSRATADFVARLCADLDLSAAQRGALFDAAGLRNPYPDRALSSTEIATALDRLDRFVLSNWPFPAFVLDRDWSVLRANAPARAMFAAFGIDLEAGPVSLLAVVLSPAFRDAILNWEAASVGMYFRLQRAAEHDRQLANAFRAAKRDGVFDHIPAQITGPPAETPLAGVEMRAPTGQVLRMIPLVGQLAMAHSMSGQICHYSTPPREATLLHDCSGTDA